MNKDNPFRPDANLEEAYRREAYTNEAVLQILATVRRIENMVEDIVGELKRVKQEKAK